MTSSRRSLEQGFRYELRTPDGDDAGTFETGAADWQVGDVFRAEGNRQFRIRAMVPLERIEEFVGRPLYGVWEVEPVIEHAVPSASVADAEAGT